MGKLDTSRDVREKKYAARVREEYVLLTILRSCSGGRNRCDCVRVVDKPQAFPARAGICVARVACGINVSIWLDSIPTSGDQAAGIASYSSAFASAIASSVAERDPAAARNAMRAIGQIPGMQYAGIILSGGDTLTEIGIAAQLDSDLRIDGAKQMSLWRALTSRSVEVTVPIRESGGVVGEFVLVGDASDFAGNLLNRCG